MQRGDDRLAFAADNVRRVVLVLIVRFHHVEDHRLRLIAGGAPHTGEALLQVTSKGGVVWHMGPLGGERPLAVSLKETPPEGMAGGVLCRQILGVVTCRAVMPSTRSAGISFL